VEVPSWWAESQVSTMPLFPASPASGWVRRVDALCTWNALRVSLQQFSHPVASASCPRRPQEPPCPGKTSRHCAEGEKVPKTEFYLPQPCFTGLFQTATLELFPYQPPPEARWAIAMDGGHQQGEVKRTRTQVSLTRPSTCSWPI
jgi:hypothetical protein